MCIYEGKREKKNYERKRHSEMFEAQRLYVDIAFCSTIFVSGQYYHNYHISMNSIVGRLAVIAVAICFHLTLLKQAN